MYLKFSQQIFEKKKNTRTSNFMKICQVGAELFHAEGRQTDEQIEMTMLINTFRHFANAPNSKNNNNNTLELKEKKSVR